MKLVNNIFALEMSKIAAVFKKLNGKATAGNEGDVMGWTPADLQRRRLMAFVRKIQVTGKGVSSGVANVMNEFSINVDTFDYDNLTFDLYCLSTNGLVSVGLNHEMTELDNHVKICYEIEKPGHYMLDIKYLGLTVPNAPFKINVQKWNAIKAKDVIAFGKGLKRCMPGHATTVRLETKKILGRGRLAVTAYGVEQIPLCLRESKSGYEVQYVCEKKGIFYLRIKVDGQHIIGSPFMITADDGQIPGSGKNLFKRGVLAGSKEKKIDLMC